MRTELGDDDFVYKVVVNDEGQYSIWPAQRANPLGWQDAGPSGTKADCLAYIGQVWTDMRTLSVRKQLRTSQQPEASQ
jgi:MbtH protein